MNRRPSYYVVKRGNGFWQPTARMRRFGFHAVACGADGVEARNVAAAWNERWAEARATGRPIAGESGRTPGVPADKGVVYFLRTAERVKIGFSASKAFARVDDLRTGIAARVIAVLAVPGTRRDEARLHRRLAAYRHEGEWFVASPTVLRTMMRALTFGRPLDVADGEPAGNESRNGDQGAGPGSRNTAVEPFDNAEAATAA